MFEKLTSLPRGCRNNHTSALCDITRLISTKVYSHTFSIQTRLYWLFYGDELVRQSSHRRHCECLLSLSNHFCTFSHLQQIQAHCKCSLGSFEMASGHHHWFQVMEVSHFLFRNSSVIRINCNCLAKCGCSSRPI